VETTDGPELEKLFPVGQFILSDMWVQLFVDLVRCVPTRIGTQTYLLAFEVT
jgi:hypothetical protein